MLALVLRLIVLALAVLATAVDADTFAIVVDLFVGVMSVREIQQLWPILSRYLRSDDNDTPAAPHPRQRFLLIWSALISAALIALLAPKVLGALL